MSRKVILDVDPGIDDAVAICLALFDPRLDVVAITATAGNVTADQATRNVQAIIEQLDPPRWPRIGAAQVDLPRPMYSRQIHGVDGLGDSNFNVSELHHQHPSEKVICDEIRTASGDVTLLTLGPLTNVAAALQRDPGLHETMGQLVVMGGTYAGPGNVTQVAEFNMHCDPEAARLVMRTPLTTTLIPLDVTSQVVMTLDHFDQLPDESTRVGSFLRKILLFAFRSHRQNWGMEGIFLHDAVAIVSLLHPELFETKRLPCDVEVAGQLTSGMTVFDRRARSSEPATIEVATGIDAAAVMDCIMRGLTIRK